MNDLYKITKPKIAAVPIVISCPHSGTNFPNEIKDQFKERYIHHPDDTDWFVNKLYDFAPSMGITLLEANLSRYVVDLNRDPASKRLYDDGRSETALIPTKSFAQLSLHKDGAKLTPEEIDRRLNEYYWPYYKKISEIITSFKKEHENVLFFDAHSIKRHVKSINPEAFNDLIVGTQDYTTASKELCDVVEDHLKETTYSVSSNKPFKGGHLTRYISNPDHGIHGIQLEMSQDVYMDEEKTLYDELKAEKIRNVLKEMFEKLVLKIEVLK